MLVNVVGATEQGSVDRQRQLTAPWLGLDLPVARTKPQAATLEARECSLGILPGGSTNVFARTLGMPNAPVAAVQLLDIRGDEIRFRVVPGTAADSIASRRIETIRFTPSASVSRPCVSIR
jgi:hypothetical protein